MCAAAAQRDRDVGVEVEGVGDSRRLGMSAGAAHSD